ncbi:MAG: peptidoglycan DD-metalloendopeptidase family protein [Patescibacteria group bacterium]|nr:peptidoglycan DD-metalloendopeptidase family protein [Patescibacteria group bacterium]
MKFLLAAIVLTISLMAQTVSAHAIYIKKNPTNEAGIEFGVDNASGFSSWRAYVKGESNNGQGQNGGWTYANGWWYYNLTSVTQRVLWRTTGVDNQKFMVTYWVFKSDGSWEYGPQVEVISDTQLPTASFTNLVNGNVYQQSTFNVSVSASDNLSGVEAVRIYVVAPSGYVMNGWLPSGLPNQYYLEFSSSSVNYNFIAPAEGQYIFTLWVRDRAGNVAYEPGGPVTISVNLTAPIFNYTCNTVNYTCSQSSSGAYSTLVDCQTNCVAPPVVKYSCNTANYTCSQNSSGSFGTLSDCQSNCAAPPVTKYVCNTANYTCSQSSSGPYSSLTDCQSSCQAPPPVDNLADYLIYPMRCDKIYRIEADSEVPVGACFDYQPFGSLFAYQSKVHLGADLNLKGVDDLGEPLYAIGDALVYNFGWTSGWGNYLILQIKTKPDKPFVLSNGQNVSQIYVLYGHLNEIKIVKDDGTVISSSQIVKKSTYVKVGWQVGTVGNGNGNFSPHLHFEIRINDYDQLGPGYWPVDDYATYLKYWADPIEFIENNMNESMKMPRKLFIHGYDLDDSKPAYVQLDTLSWELSGRLSDGLPLASVGWSNHFWLINSNIDRAGSWHFHVPTPGAYSIYVIVPRYYATATKVRYQTWHSRTTVLNPYSVLIDQSNNNQDKVIYLGTFDYLANTDYSVDVFSKTTDSPAKTVAFDTVMLVYEGDFGTGGGGLPPPPSTVCGNGICEDGEAETCAVDCPQPPQPTCGNLICEEGETAESCPSDCPDNPSATNNDGGNTDGSGGQSAGFGCQIITAQSSGYNLLANWLLILCPAFVSLIRRYFHD